MRSIALALLSIAACTPSFDEVECYSTSDCLTPEHCVDGQCLLPDNMNNQLPPPNQTPADAGARDATPTPPPDAGTSPDAGTVQCLAPNICIDCRGRSCEHLECGGETSCIIDCRSGGDCHKVECKGGAECLMLCEGSQRCEFERCRSGGDDDDDEGGGGMMCPGNILVCNRPCP